MGKLKFRISGMECDACQGYIESSLKQLAGITAARVSFQEKQGSVEFDPSKISKEKILKSPIFSAPSAFRAEVLEGPS